MKPAHGAEPPLHLVLINPNTSAATTAAMVAIARETAGPRARIEGRTAPFGAALITSPAALATAAEAVRALAPGLGNPRGVIVAAFGDPGRDALAAMLDCPVTGIAEAGMAEAAAAGRRFAVVTTTPDLRTAISDTARRWGHARFAGTWVTDGPPEKIMADPVILQDALLAACLAAISLGGAEAIVIGGGPLAVAARALVARVPVPLIEPVPAAVRLACARAQGKR